MTTLTTMPPSAFPSPVFFRIIASHSCARALCDHVRNLKDDQLRALAKNRGVVGVNFYSGFLSQSFYDRKKGCTVYPVRPPQCRTWPFWESNVATPEAWRRACAACPGSGRGELIAAEEITRRLKVIRL